MNMMNRLFGTVRRNLSKELYDELMTRLYHKLNNLPSVTLLCNEIQIFVAVKFVDFLLPVAVKMSAQTFLWWGTFRNKTISTCRLKNAAFWLDDVGISLFLCDVTILYGIFSEMLPGYFVKFNACYQHDEEQKVCYGDMWRCHTIT